MTGAGKRNTIQLGCTRLLSYLPGQVVTVGGVQLIGTVAMMRNQTNWKLRQR